MMLRKTGQIWMVGLFVLAALLAGCGDDDDGGGGDDASGSASAPADEGGDEDGGSARGSDTLSGELEDGSTLVVHLDVPADDEAVAPFEEFRTLAGGDDVTWIVGEITVPDGTDGTGRFVTFVGEGLEAIDDDPMDDSDGITNAEFACSQIGEWFAAVETPEQDVNDAYNALYEGPCGGQTLQVVAPAGETATYVMVYPGELPEYERVFAGLATELEPA